MLYNQGASPGRGASLVQPQPGAFLLAVDTRIPASVTTQKRVSPFDGNGLEALPPWYNQRWLPWLSRENELGLVQFK